MVNLLCLRKDGLRSKGLNMIHLQNEMVHLFYLRKDELRNIKYYLVGE